MWQTPALGIDNCEYCGGGRLDAVAAASIMACPFVVCICSMFWVRLKGKTIFIRSTLQLKNQDKLSTVVKCACCT